MFARALLLSLAIAAPGAAEAPLSGTRVEPPPSSLRMVLNIPAYRLEVYDGDEKIRSYTVTIGMPRYPTPSGGFSITRIEWNPWWTPPDSKWAEGKEKTAPGPRNPMGRAKLQFDDYLYVHGTALTKQIGGAHSHGCVRLKNADVLDLARLVATRTGVLSEAEISRLENNSKATRSVRLPSPIPIQIRYALTERKEDGTVVKRKDVYGLGDRDSTIARDAEVVAAEKAEAGGTVEPTAAEMGADVDSVETPDAQIGDAETVGAAAR
jgi:murein L,D-transpeptidase YcbB/YkuD